MSFGDRLRFLIEERGITQKDLAREFNIAASTMGCYVQNKREPDFATLKAFSEYFNVSVDYLLERSLKSSSSQLEAELLRVFHSLTPEQQRIYLEQGRAFLRVLGEDKHTKQTLL